MTTPPTRDVTRRLPPDDLVFRYLAGRLEPSEAERVRMQLEAAGVPAGTIAGLRDTLQADALTQGANARGETGALQGSLHALFARIDHAEGEAASAIARRSFGAWRRAAAVGIGLAAVTLVGIVVGGRLHESTRVASSDPFDGPRYTTARGERVTITLRDGTRVTLAPQSVLQLPRQFGDATRMIALVGEARFDVASHRATPFIVSTGHAETRVLGTTFDVRHYADDPATHVAVTSGRVSLALRAPTGRASVARVLDAGMIGVATDSAVAAHASSESAPQTTWSNDLLVFHRVPAAEALATLSRWYDYDFRVADSAVVAQSITAQFNVQSPREALATLRVVFDVDLSFDGRIVTLTPRRTSRAVDTAKRRDPVRTLTTEVGR